MWRPLSALALAAAAFGVGLAVGLTVQRGRPAAVRSVTTKVVTEAGSRGAGSKPAPLPTFVEGAVDPHQIPLSTAVPADAEVDSADYVDAAPKQLIVTWERAHVTRGGRAAIWQRRGIAVWQLDSERTARWHRAYTYEAPLTNATGVEGFRISLGDISGDGRPEVLVFFDTDGSAGGGTYHLLADDGRRLRQPLVKELSLDQGTITFAHGALLIRRGVDYAGPGIHCCYRKVRLTWLRWTGRRLVVVRRETRPNRRRWPPG